MFFCAIHRLNVRQTPINQPVPFTQLKPETHGPTLTADRLSVGRRVSGGLSVARWSSKMSTKKNIYSYSFIFVHSSPILHAAAALFSACPSTCACVRRHVRTSRTSVLLAAIKQCSIIPHRRIVFFRPHCVFFFIILCFSSSLFVLKVKMSPLFIKGYLT